MAIAWTTFASLVFGAAIARKPENNDFQEENQPLEATDATVSESKNNDAETVVLPVVETFADAVSVFVGVISGAIVVPFMDGTPGLVATFPTAKRNYAELSDLTGWPTMPSDKSFASLLAANGCQRVRPSDRGYADVRARTLNAKHKTKAGDQARPVLFIFPDAGATQ